MFFQSDFVPKRTASKCKLKVNIIISHNCGLPSLPQLNISRQAIENKRKPLIGHSNKSTNQMASLF